MSKITKDVREGGVKELLFADDLVMLGDSLKEVEMRYAQWKKAAIEKGLLVNVKKQKRENYNNESLNCMLRM